MNPMNSTSNLQAAFHQFDLGQAVQVFLQTIDAAQQQALSNETLEQFRDEAVGKLDFHWPILEELAFAGGDDRTLGASFAVVLEEWAIKEALELLLRNSGTFIDPASPGLHDDFRGKLVREHQLLTAELVLKQEAGKQTRRTWHRRCYTSSTSTSWTGRMQHFSSCSSATSTSWTGRRQPTGCSRSNVNSGR